MVVHNSDATDYEISSSNNSVMDVGFNIKYVAAEDEKLSTKRTEDEEKLTPGTEVKTQVYTQKEDIKNKKKYKSYADSKGIPFFFFSWMTNWIKYVGKGKLKHEEFPEIPNEDFDQEATARFGVFLEDYRDYDSCNKLVKFVGRSRLCVLKVFRKNFILLYLFSIFNDVFEVFNIFLLKHVMKQKLPTTMTELFKYLVLVFLVLTVNMVDIVTDGHHHFYYRRLVLRIENLLFSFLFSRILSKNYYSLTDVPSEGHQTIRRLDTDISITMLPKFHNSSYLLDSSNNIKLEEKKAKKFIESKKDKDNNDTVDTKDNKGNNDGEKDKGWVGDEEDISLLNLALFDISEISWGILKLVDLCAIPLKIMIIGCWLYYQVGATALKAIIFILISSTIMVLSECQSAKLVKGYVTRIDDRISKTLIILENLTNFKMFRWIDLCKHSVLSSRLMELQLCMKRAILSAIGSWLGISLPNILALAVFLIYSTNSKNGASLDPSFSIPLLHTLNHFIKPFRELPSDLSDHLETSISCNRIESFLFSKELSTYIVTSYSFKKNKKKKDKNKTKKEKTKEDKDLPYSDENKENHKKNTIYIDDNNQYRDNEYTNQDEIKESNISKIRFSNMQRTGLEVIKDYEGEETVKTTSIYDEMGDTGRSTVIIGTDNNIDIENEVTTREEDVEIVGLEEFSKEIGNIIDEEIEYKRKIKIKEYNKYMKDENTCVVYMKGATFCRGDKKVLNRINFRLEKRDKVIISGSNISEKFIFTMSLIDELQHTEGIYYNHYIRKDICTGIVSQNPWIPMGTIREIIVFGNEYNKMLYEKVLEICQLKYDFSNWKLGDLRFVDEGGQNLSTGQKVRISLARSLYRLLINENNNNKENKDNISNKRNQEIIKEYREYQEYNREEYNQDNQETINIYSKNNKYENQEIKEQIKNKNRDKNIGSMIILDEIFTVLDPVIGCTIFNNLFGEGGILNRFTCVVTVQDSFLQILKGFKFDEKFKFYNLSCNYIRQIKIVQHEIDETSKELMKRMGTIRQETVIENNNIDNKNTNIEDIEIISTRREVEEIDYSKITLIGLDNYENKDKEYGEELETTLREGILGDNSNKENTNQDDNNKVEKLKIREEYLKIIESSEIEIKEQDDQRQDNEKKEEIGEDVKVELDSTEQKLARSRLFTNEKDDNPMLVKLDNFVWYLKKVGLGLVGFVLSLSFVAMSLNVASDIVISKWTSVPSDSISKIKERMMIINGIYSDNYFTKLNYLYVFTFIASCIIVLYLWRSLLEVHGTMNAAHKVYSSAMNGVLKCPIVTFNQIPIGNINNRLSADQSYVDYSVFRRFSHFVSSFIFTVLTAMSLCYLNPWSMLLIPILVLVSYFCVFKMYIPMSIFNMRSNLETRGYICTQFSQVIAGAHVIKSLNNERYVMESFLKYLRIHQRTKFFCHAASSWTMIRLRVLTYPLIVINLLIPLMPLFKNADFNSVASKEIARRKKRSIGLGNEDDGYMSTKGDMVDGKLGLALTYSYKFAKLLKSSLNKVVELETEMCASQRLQELSKLDPDYNILDEKLFDSKKAKEKVKNFIKKRIQEINFRTNIGSEYNTKIDCNIVGERYLDVHHGLSVNKVVVKYDSKMCLNRITFNTEKNEHIGLIGRTGAGKSTLLMCLSGLIKLDSGNIKIDGIDISELSNEEMRQLIAILPHTPPLLPGWSVRRYVDPENEYSDEEIFEGVKNCKLIRLLSNLLENSKNNKEDEREKTKNTKNKKNNNNNKYNKEYTNQDNIRYGGYYGDENMDEYEHDGLGGRGIFDNYKEERNNNKRKEERIIISSNDYNEYENMDINSDNENRIEYTYREEYNESRKIIKNEKEKIENMIDLIDIENEITKREEGQEKEYEKINQAMKMRITKQKENNYVLVSDIDLQYLTLLRLYLSRKKLRLILIDECYTVEQGNIMELEPIYLMINRLFKENVIIIVAHQPESLRLCNRILLLEGGKIVETEFKN